MLRKEYPPGALIVKEGTVLDTLCIVSDGVLVARGEDHGREIEVARFAPGEYFGELALLTGEPLQARFTALTRVVIYEISKGATYYESTWRGPAGEGAMMEHYDKRCLPIFPISNHFTCSFISLGDTAFFVTYKEDRPKGMPEVCLFSPSNHPPRTDFISHLPYSSGDSERLGNRVQGYSFWVAASTGKPIQVGVSPDRTNDQAIMFGYGFMSKATADRVDKSAKPYRHPQSFYFSGYPLPPANAPMVSQNYTNFAMVRPDPKTTWDLVSKRDPKSLPQCQLFNPPSEMVGLTSTPRAPTWGDIKHR